jgi:CRISPR-associated endonuclease/helicase Cas3
VLLKRNTETVEASALPLDSIYAKTIVESDGSVHFGLDLYSHSIIVGVVASLLVELFPKQIRDRVFPLGVSLVAACHDIGKANPMFMKKLYQDVHGEQVESFPQFKGVSVRHEEQTGYHAGVSKSFFLDQDPAIAEIVGAHHGFIAVNAKMVEDEVIGGAAWNDVRRELFDKLREYLQVDLPSIDSLHQRTAITGLVTVADWIGSGTVFSNLRRLDESSLEPFARKAITYAGFVRPAIRKGLSFEDVFGFEPWDAQQTLVDAIEAPGTYIMEALMGQGKTEAALYSAYKLLEREEATGIYFALPTRLTSDRMYARMKRFLSNILEDSERQKLFLLHGNAWLFETHMGEEGEVGKTWFDIGKRKILAPFGVGTLDQALLAVLHVRHNAVRSFGLVGKVVILDEIHSYDAYTGALIRYLIKELEALGSTVIMLSATLTKNRKEELLDESLSNEARSYPLVTSKTEAGIVHSLPRVPEDSLCTTQCTSDYDKAVALARQVALEGGQVLWIENTVLDAQKSFLQFGSWAKEAGIEVGLLHSRFPAYRRSELEDVWVGRYGKDAQNERRGRILVGTQVLEQSLDIDADLLITRLAPSDMLLQRIGRLWRHRSNDRFRPKGLEKTALIITPDIDGRFNPQVGFGSSGLVYEPYVLIQTYKVWKDLKRIAIPSDVPTILDRTYESNPETEIERKLRADLIRKREELGRKANVGVSMANPTLSEQILTRYSEVGTCPLLLVRNLPAKGSTKWVLLDGSIIDCSLRDDDSKLEIAKRIMQNIIVGPIYSMPDAQSLSELAWIRPYYYIDEEQESRLRIALLEESGTIRALQGGEANEDYDLTYTDHLGFRAVKRR